MSLSFRVVSVVRAINYSNVVATWAKATSVVWFREAQRDLGLVADFSCMAFVKKIFSSKKEEGCKNWSYVFRVLLYLIIAESSEMAGDLADKTAALSLNDTRDVETATFALS